MTTTTTTPATPTTSTTARVATDAQNFEDDSEIIEIPDPGVNIEEETEPGFVGGDNGSGKDENMVTDNSPPNSASDHHFTMYRTFCTIVNLHAFFFVLLRR